MLVADTREFGDLEFVPGILQIAAKAEKIKKLINFHFGENDTRDTRATAETIRKSLYIPLMHIITDTRRFISVFKSSYPHFVTDGEHLLRAANSMHEVLESELIDLHIKSGSEETYLSANMDDVSSESSITTLPEHIIIDSDETILGTASLNPARILVVDDSPIYHRMISHHLKALGHAVFNVNSGPEAISWLEKQHADIIIMDVLMPGMTGSSTLRQLKQNARLADTPVIMMSAVNNSASIAQCIKLGAEDYLPKDFDPVILRARIDACMEKRALHEQQMVFMQALLTSQRALAQELSDAGSYIVSQIPPSMNQPIQAAARLIPSAQLGGDFCAYHWTDENHLALYLLDVGGHGIKSALLAVSISNIIRNKAIPDLNFNEPGAVLTALNSLFQTSGTDTTFFSLWYGVYDLYSSKLSFAAGGSPPACVIRSGQENKVETLDSYDLVLGASETYQYYSRQIVLYPGDRLYVYSDGIYETKKSGGGCLGIPEFHKLLTLQQTDPMETIDHLIQSVLSLTHAESFEDDVSLIVLQI